MNDDGHALTLFVPRYQVLFYRGYVHLVFKRIFNYFSQKSFYLFLTLCAQDSILLALDILSTYCYGEWYTAS